MNNKKSLIRILIYITFVLVFVEIIVRSFFTEKKVTVKQFYPNEINRIFLKSLSDFGIDESHISEQKIKINNLDTLISSYTIETPFDLNMVELLATLNEQLYYNGIVIKSKELVINKDTEASFELSGKLLFKANFKYNKNFIRTKNKFSIIVDGLDNLNNDEIEVLLNVPADICFTLLPTTNNLELTTKINKYGKSYSIKIDDNIDDPPFLMNEKQHPEKIISSLSNIFSHFSKTNLIIINDNSDFYKSNKFRFVIKNISKDYIVKKISELINLGDRDEAELASLFRFYAEKDEAKKKFFYFNTDQFFKIKNELLRLKRRGNNIMPPSILYEID